MKLNENRRVILGCIIGGFLGGFAIATCWKSQTDKSFWDIATAIGTVAAAVVAVGIALWQDRVRRSDSELRARLVATTLVDRMKRNVDRLQAASLVIRDAHSRVETSKGLKQTMFSFAERAVWIRQAAESASEYIRAIEEISLNELATVSVLNVRHAEELARSAAQTKYIGKQLEPGHYRSMTDDGRAALVTQIQDAKALLRPALTEFERITFESPRMERAATHL